MIENEPTPVNNHLTRRERRIERGRARRAQMLAGWVGYGFSVFMVIVVAAWLAVRGISAAPPTHAHSSPTGSTTPGAALPPSTPSTSGDRTQTVSVPADVPETPVTAATPTTTTPPVVAAVATPTP